MTDRVSDEQLNHLIAWFKYSTNKAVMPSVLSALVELRDRRLAEKAPCPEHAKMMAKRCTCPRCNTGTLDVEAYYKDAPGDKP